MTQNPQITLEFFTQETLQRAPEFFAFVDKNRDYLRQRMPWADNVQSLDDTHQFIKRILGRQQNHELIFAFMSNKKGPLIGAVHAHNLDTDTGTLAYWVGASFQGQGYTSFACHLLVKYIKKKAFPNLKTLRIRCEPDNIASARIAQKCGFQYKSHQKQAMELYGKPIDLDSYILELESLPIA